MSVCHNGVDVSRPDEHSPRQEHGGISSPAEYILLVCSSAMLLSTALRKGFCNWAKYLVGEHMYLSHSIYMSYGGKENSNLYRFWRKKSCSFLY